METTETVETTEITQPAVSAEVAEMMAISLNGGFTPKPIEELAPPVETTSAPEAVATTFEILKEKFSYETPDDAIREIEELRQFKATPQIVEPKYENEQSKKIVQALQAGKMDEVFQVLNEQRTIDRLVTTDVTKETAGEIIKLSMQLKHKDLTPQEIDYKFNKQFGIPKEPVELVTETEEEFKERHDQWKEQVADVEMNRIIEAKTAKPELEVAKSKLVIPDITVQEDNDYAQWKNLMSEQSKINAVIEEEYKGITPKDVETKLDFNDEANKIAFQFQYEPDADSFKQTVEMATDVDKFLNSFVSEGKFDKRGFLEAVHFAKNKDRILLEAMKQSKNATIKSSLPDNNGGTQRQFPSMQEPSDLDKQMQMSLGQYMPKTR